MLFSVIVPVYNIEDWLKKCVDSILNQRYKDYELLLIDDGSTDSSGQLCDWYQKNYHNIQVVHKKNGGLSDARNCGIRCAKGEYLLFVDGDDYIAEWTLEKLSNIIRENYPDIILSEGMYHVQNGNAIVKKTFCSERVNMISGKDAVLYTSSISPNWSACDKCFRAAFWQEHSFKFCKGRLAEDMQLIDKVVLCAESVYMIPAFYYQQEREESITHNVNIKFIEDILKNLSEWKEYFKENSLDEKIVQQLSVLQIKTVRHFIWGNLCFVDEEYRNKILRETEQYIGYMQYSSSPEFKLINILIQLIGLKRTCFLLGIVKKTRNRKR